MKLLQKIFDDLESLRKVKNKSDFAKKIDYDNGYISKMLNSEDVLPIKLQYKLTEVFGISKEYLETNGEKGSMFERKDKPYTHVKSDSIVNEPNNHTLTESYSIDSDFTKPNQEIMIRDLMNELRESNATMKMLAQAVLNTSDANKSLARSVEQLSGQPRRSEDQNLKSKAS